MPFAGNLIRLTMLLCLAGLLPSPTLAQTIVWTDENGDRIQRKDAGGGPVTTVIQFPFPKSASRIHYDPRGNKLYYLVAPGNGPLIFERSNVDGTASEAIPTPSAGRFSINIESRNLHWIEPPSTVHRAALDGSAIESHTFTGVVNVLETVGNDLFFMATTAQAKAVWHSNIDGSNAQLLHHTGSPGDLAFDPVDQKIYFSSIGGIDRGNVDGTGFEQVVHLPAWEQNTQIPEQISVDPVGRKLYWLDQVARLVQRSNLDGSDIEDFVTASQAGNPELELKGLTIVQPLSIPATSTGGLAGCCLALILAGSLIARRAIKQNH